MEMRDPCFGVTGWCAKGHILIGREGQLETALEDGRAGTDQDAPMRELDRTPRATRRSALRRRS